VLNSLTFILKKLVTNILSCADKAFKLHQLADICSNTTYSYCITNIPESEEGHI